MGPAAALPPPPLQPRSLRRRRAPRQGATRRRRSPRRARAGPPPGCRPPDLPGGCRRGRGSACETGRCPRRLPRAKPGQALAAQPASEPPTIPAAQPKMAFCRLPAGSGAAAAARGSASSTAGPVSTASFPAGKHSRQRAPGGSETDAMPDDRSFGRGPASSAARGKPSAAGCTGWSRGRPAAGELRMRLHRPGWRRVLGNTRNRDSGV